MEKFIRKHSPSPFENTKLVDLGTGTGSYIIKLLESGIGQVTCVDFSDKMLNTAKAKIKNAGFEDRTSFLKAFLPKVDLERYIICELCKCYKFQN